MICAPFALSLISFCFCFRCIFKMMHYLYKYANEIGVAIKYFSTLFIFSGDYFKLREGKETCSESPRQFLGIISLMFLCLV
jgi:hypothetical protein